MAWRGPEAEKGPSRRSRRRLAIRALRDQGRYGPGLREVLPALAGVVMTVCGVVAGVAVAYRTLGVGVLVAASALLAVATPVAVRHHRPLARRRLGHYTPEELADLDTEGLVLAVSRMLRRDGWLVLPPSTVQDRPRVRARNGQGHRIEVAFRPVAEPLPDEDAPARSGRRTGTPCDSWCTGGPSATVTSSGPGARATSTSSTARASGAGRTAPPAPADRCLLSARRLPGPRGGPRPPAPGNPPRPLVHRRIRRAAPRPGRRRDPYDRPSRGPESRRTHVPHTKPPSRPPQP